MPIYTYKALISNGQELTREAASPSERELRQELEAQGVLVKAIRPKRMMSGIWGGQAVRQEDFLRTNQEMATLLRAGLTLPEVLELAADRPESPVLASILRRILV